jgi:iron complex transport system substrate-binding protein
VPRAPFLRPRLLAAVFVSVLFACGRGETPVAPPEPATRVVRDDARREVTLPRDVHRVVTLAPNLTEIVFAIGGGPMIAGTDDYSDYPPQAKLLPKVGGVQANVEKIAALAPDVVISKSSYHPTLPSALASAKVPLFVSHNDRLAEIAPSMLSLGNLLGIDARKAAADLNVAIESNRRIRRKKPRVLFVVLASPLYVAGRDTFVDDLFRLTGAENAVALSGWPQYSLESLTANPPDIILHPDRTVTRQQIEALGVKAEIIAVDEDRFSRPGPRVGAAAKELNSILDLRQWL